MKPQDEALGNPRAAAPSSRPPLGPSPAVSSQPGSYRRKRSASRVVSERAALAGTAYSAMVEIADRCNEACVHCYQVQGQKGELDTEHWKRVFGELAEMGVIFLTITGGEPTLRKDFLELVAHARQLRFAVKIYSNALNITPSMAAELGRLAVQEVQISLYSHLPEVHDGVTRVTGSFDKVVSATRALRANGVKVLLKSPLLQQNSASFREYADFVANLGADYALDPHLSPREDGSLAPTAFSAGKSEVFSLSRDARFASAKDQPFHTPKRKNPCGACKSNVHIEPNGELRPCTQWSIATGHVRQGVKNAWQDNATANAIRALTWDHLPSCRSCDLQDYCQRCFAKAEQYVGNALAPYPNACRTARWRYELQHGTAPEIETNTDSCPTAPLGPFQAAGEHRFVVAAKAADTGSHEAPEVDRTWLHGALERPEPTPANLGQLVQIRRHKTAPLRVATVPPSDQ